MCSFSHFPRGCVSWLPIPSPCCDCGLPSLDDDANECVLSCARSAIRYKKKKTRSPKRAQGNSIHLSVLVHLFRLAVRMRCDTIASFSFESPKAQVSLRPGVVITSSFHVPQTHSRQADLLPFGAAGFKKHQTCERSKRRNQEWSRWGLEVFGVCQAADHLLFQVECAQSEIDILLQLGELSMSVLDHIPINFETRPTLFCWSNWVPSEGRWPEGVDPVRVVR